MKRKRAANVANVVPSVRKPKKPKNKTAAQRQLDADFAAMMERHAKPLEHGAKTKGKLPEVKTKKKRQSKHVQEVTVPPLVPPPGRESAKLPSKVTPGGSTAKRDAQQYTGTKMLGVATMHKSNTVPVFSEQEAEEIAKMRRNEYDRSKR